MKRMKRMVTDPTTGERTAMTTTNKDGRVEWTVSKELRDDYDRARVKSKRKEDALNKFRRAIDV